MGASSSVGSWMRTEELAPMGRSYHPANPAWSIS